MGVEVVEDHQDHQDLLLLLLVEVLVVEVGDLEHREEARGQEGDQEQAELGRELVGLEEVLGPLIIKLNILIFKTNITT